MPPGRSATDRHILSAVDTDVSWADHAAIPNPLYTEEAFKRSTSRPSAAVTPTASSRNASISTTISSQSLPGPSKARSNSASTGSNSRTHKRRNPNEVRAKPANPHIISTMLNALDTITPPSDAERRTYFEVQGPSRSVPRPSSIVKASTPPVRPGPIHGFSFGIEEDSTPALQEDISADQADFPVIRTTRRPSERSQISVDSASAQQGTGLMRLIRSASSRSKSPVSPQPVGEGHDRISPVEHRPGKKKTRIRLGMDEDEPLSAPANNSPVTMIAPLPTTSQALRGKSRSSSSKPKQSDGFVIVKPYTTPEAPKRLVVREDSPLDASPHVPQSNANVSNRPATSPSLGTLDSTKSASRNPIADAIPLRTSSLNQADNQFLDQIKTRKNRSGSSRTGGKDKGKKKKLSLSEDVLEELGEEDETVKRIKELKLQKEARLNRLVTQNPNAEGSSSSDIRSHSIPSPAESRDDPIVSPISDHQSPDRMVATMRIITRNKDDSKARKLLGIDADAEGSLTSRVSHARPPTSNSPARKKPANLNLDGLGFPSDNVADQTYDRRPRPIAHAANLADVGSDRRARNMNALDLDSARSASPMSNSSYGHRVNGSRSTLRKSLSVSHSETSGIRKALHSNGSMYDPDEVDRRQTMIWADAFAKDAIDDRRRSVDEAVDGFLRHQRLNQTVRHPKTGRKIAFAEVGDPNGAVVFVCVGMGLTRFVSTFYDELASTLKLRLITPDRPGVGGSEPHPERERHGPLTWHQDVAAICSKLDITEFSLLAHSAGAIYALATALVLPHYVRGKVHLLAPWIPPSQFQSYSNRVGTDLMPVGNLPRSQRLLRVLPTSFLKAANTNFLGMNNNPSSPTTKRTTPNGKPASRSPERRIPQSTSPVSDPAEMARKQSLVGIDQLVSPQSGGFGFPMPLGSSDKTGVSVREDEDQVRLSATASPLEADFTFAASALNAAQHNEQEKEAAYNSALTERTWELATRNSNPTIDLLVCLERNRDIGFRYVDIQRRIVITHGSDDKRVPVENVKWLADQINRRTPAMVEPGHEFFDDFYQKSGCDVRVLPGEEHGLMASPVVMADVLSEIAREWRTRKSSVSR
ncbi:hypothetical protein MBLNU457_5485t1 [Dothideomycetes sp. NU457]